MLGQRLVKVRVHWCLQTHWGILPEETSLLGDAGLKNLFFWQGMDLERVEMDGLKSVVTIRKTNQ